MKQAKPKKPEPIVRYADMFAAMGTESRLRIMQVLLSAYPDGMVGGKFKANWASRHRLCRTIWTS